MALHQLAFRHPGHVRISQRQLLLLPGMVDYECRFAPVAALELARSGRPGNRRARIEQLRRGGVISKRTKPRSARNVYGIQNSSGAKNMRREFLSAKGFNGGQPVAEAKAETTGEPAVVQLSANRGVINADARDVSVITVSVRDFSARIPVASNKNSLCTQRSRQNHRRWQRRPKLPRTGPIHCPGAVPHQARHGLALEKRA